MIVVVLYLNGNFFINVHSLQKDPSQRPDIDQLLNEPWLEWTEKDDSKVDNWLQEKFT